VSVKEGKWKDACSTVGELVLIYTALDHQLNRIVIEVMHLAASPTLEAVVATFDARQKVEMLKNRAAHVNWRKAIKTHADRIERVAKIIPSKQREGFEFAPAAASKLLKSMTVRSKDDYDIERLTLENVHEAIALAEKALGGGENLLVNFAKVSAAMAAQKTSATSLANDL
jgi:hypothetical protein